jgi:hypothetical protein
MNNYQNWIKGKTPHTCKNATIKKLKSVKDAEVIEVQNAKYRNATLSGIFLLDNTSKTVLPGRVKVNCSWFGVTPPTTYPQIDLTNAQSAVISNYTGNVADDIST